MRRPSRGTILTLALLGILLIALTVIGLVLQRHDDRTGFLLLASAEGAIYLGAVWTLRGVPATRLALIIILGIAALLRLLLLAAPIYLSTDIYRYVWDGRVQAAGVNPYRYVPADPALADLRDREIYPNINRKDYATTIYPPVAQAIFLGVTRLSESPTVMRLAMVGFEAAAVGLLLVLLRRTALPATRVLIYAWHPLAVWEFAGSGHIDAAMIALVCLALVLRQSARAGWAGAALAAASLVKPFPLSIAPALYRRWDWRFPAAFLATACLAYLPYLGVGSRVLGFLPGYVQEEGLASGNGFYPLWLLRHTLGLDLPATAYAAASLLLLLSLALWVVLRRDPRDQIASATILALAFVFLVTPHYPSYLAWLLVLGVLEPSVPLLYMTSISFLLYLPVDLGVTGSIVYGGTALLLLLRRFKPKFKLFPSEVPHVVDYPR
jgi:alpha-1,6-mannosyltransferase